MDSMIKLLERLCGFPDSHFDAYSKILSEYAPFEDLRETRLT